MRREAQRTGVFTRRALLIAGAQVGALGLLGGRLYQVQVVEGARYATLAESNRVSTRLIAPARGRLLDRFGTVMAGNRLNWRALLVAEQTEDVDGTLDNLSRIIELPDHERARIERELRGRRRFIPVTVREFLTWEQMAGIEVNAPDLPGVVVDVGTTREYPFSEALAHVVGYVAPPADDDIEDNPTMSLPGIRVGRAGVEKFHDELLLGRAGAVQVEVNALGRVVRELDREEGTPGAEITLTIDTGLQKSVIARLGDESASCVVMDARSGEVLAMATNPSFVPSLFNSGVSQSQWTEWTTDRRTPLVNKAAAGLYSPGSTFKMVVALAALEAKVLSPHDHFHCPGYFDLGDRRFHCWRKEGHGSLDLRGGLKRSCDVFFYETARRTGIDRIAAMANRFGLGVKLDIELPDARTGLMPTRAWRKHQRKHWNLGDTIVSGIGQGYMQLTPLSLATMAARIANGRAVQPHLTRSIGGAMQKGADPSDWPSIDLPERDLQFIREAMWAVVNEPGGTAPLARLPIPGVELAGKTGSVQLRNVSRSVREHGYKSETLPWEYRPHALFVAFAPYKEPQFALAVVVEHGNAGAQAAAPIARDIMTDVLTRAVPAERIAERDRA
jgi:penicillin-binding protein 2